MPSQTLINKTKIFLKLYGVEIAKALVDSNIYFATAVGQKCNESGYGTSSLAKNYNNFGGIRGIPKEAIGKTSNGWAIFRRPEDCFRAYARFINELPRYNKALAESSPERQIIELVKAGYCKIPDGKIKTPNDYLKICQGAIDVTRSILPIGKITSQNIAGILSNIKYTKI